MINYIMKVTLLLLSSTLILSSCKKNCDSDVLDETIPVRAGGYNSDFHFYKFEDNYYIEIEDKGCGTSRGFEALDLNMDGETDLIISELIFDLNEYDYMACCPPPLECFPSLSYSIIYRTDTSIFEISSINNDDLHYSGHFTDTLNFNDNIDTLNTWVNRSYIIDKSQYSKNPWLKIAEDKYIGVRSYSDSTYKHGWIKIGIENERVVLREMAFQK
jgi:hypothetical protein